MIGFIGILSFGDAFADHYDQNEIPLEDDREWLRYYMIFASHEKNCSNYDEYQQLFLRSLTNQILREYNFQTTSKIDCVEVSGNVQYDKENIYSETKNNLGLTLDNAIDKAKNWHFDLLIIILDDELSKQYTDATYWLGHARYFGDYKNIVITTSASPINEWINEHLKPLRSMQEIESQDTAWTLSHELAHFALEYLGYPKADFTGYVHSIDDEYDRCVETNFRNDFCSELYYEIKRLDDRGNSYWIKVMKPPYDEIKRLRDGLTKDYEYEKNFSRLTINTSRSTTQVGDTMWINGKVINPYSNNPVYLTISDPYGRIIVNEELRVNQFSEYRHSFIIESRLFPYAGTYTVNVYYYGWNDASQTTKFTHTIPSKVADPSSTPQPTQSNIQSLERLGAKNFRILNENTDSLKTFEEIIFGIDFKNSQNIVQPYAFLVQIQNDNGDTVELKWIEANLSPGRSSSPSISWVPIKPGVYSATALGWESADNPTSLMVPMSIQFRVSEGTSQSITPVQPIYPTTPTNSDKQEKPDVKQQISTKLTFMTGYTHDDGSIVITPFLESSSGDITFSGGIIQIYIDNKFFGTTSLGSFSDRIFLDAGTHSIKLIFSTIDTGEYTILGSSTKVTYDTFNPPILCPPGTKPMKDSCLQIESNGIKSKIINLGYEDNPDFSDITPIPKLPSEIKQNNDVPVETTNDIGMIKNANTMVNKTPITGTMGDGTMISVWMSPTIIGERIQISIQFENSEHVNYDIKAIQNDKEILRYTGVHLHNGKIAFETLPLDSIDPIDIAITFQGYGIEDPKTGPIGEEVVFSSVTTKLNCRSDSKLINGVCQVVSKSESNSIKPKCGSGLKEINGQCYPISEQVVTSTNTVESNIDAPDIFEKTFSMFKNSSNSNGKVCFLFWCW